MMNGWMDGCMDGNCKERSSQKAASQENWNRWEEGEKGEGSTISDHSLCCDLI